MQQKHEFLRRNAVFKRFPTNTMLCLQFMMFSVTDADFTPHFARGKSWIWSKTRYCDAASMLPPQIKLKLARHFTSAALGIENIINGRPCSEGRALSTIMCYCHCKIIPEPKSWKSFPTSFKCDSKWILLWELARLTSLFQIQTGRRNWNGKSIASGNYVINYFVFLEDERTCIA